MRLSIEELDKLDGKTCFICGNYLLNYLNRDLAYQRVYSGKVVKMVPQRYFLFTCPNCGKTAHKRCWYDYAEVKVRGGLFRKKKWKLICPSCRTELSDEHDLIDWKRGYQIPGHPDDELPELLIQDVLAWKAGAAIGKIRMGITNFFVAVGFSSLTDPERSAIAQAAQRIGKTIQQVAERVFRLNLSGTDRSELKELKCQNCGAPLPLPESGVTAVVCEHCGTAHLLPER